MLSECIYCDKLKGIWEILRDTQHPSTSFQRTCIPESLRNCPSRNVASEKCITGCWDPFKCWILPPCCSLCLQSGLYSQHAKGRTPPYLLPFTASAWERFRFHGKTLGISVAIPSTLAQCVSVLRYLPPFSLSLTYNLQPSLFNLLLYHHPPTGPLPLSPLMMLTVIWQELIGCAWIWTVMYLQYKNLVFRTFHYNVSSQYGHKDTIATTTKNRHFSMFFLTWEVKWISCYSWGSGS